MQTLSQSKRMLNTNKRPAAAAAATASEYDNNTADNGGHHHHYHHYNSSHSNSNSSNNYSFGSNNNNNNSYGSSAGYHSCCFESSSSSAATTAAATSSSSALALSSYVPNNLVTKTKNLLYCSSANSSSANAISAACVVVVAGKRMTTANENLFFSRTHKATPASAQAGEMPNAFVLNAYANTVASASKYDDDDGGNGEDFEKNHPQLRANCYPPAQPGWPFATSAAAVDDVEGAQRRYHSNSNGYESYYGRRKKLPSPPDHHHHRTHRYETTVMDYGSGKNTGGVLQYINKRLPSSPPLPSIANATNATTNNSSPPNRTDYGNHQHHQQHQQLMSSSSSFTAQNDDKNYRNDQPATANNGSPPHRNDYGNYQHHQQLSSSTFSAADYYDCGEYGSGRRRGGGGGREVVCCNRYGGGNQSARLEKCPTIIQTADSNASLQQNTTPRHYASCSTPKRRSDKFADENEQQINAKSNDNDNHNDNDRAEAAIPPDTSSFSPQVSPRHGISPHFGLSARRSFNCHRSGRAALENSGGGASLLPGAGCASPAVSLSTQHLAPQQRPLRRCRSASPATIRAPLLSAEHQAMIRKSWQRVSKTSVGRSIYEIMTEKCKETSAFFADDLNGVERHERYFVDLIQGAVDNLTDMDIALRAWLETIGSGHSGFLIRSAHWDAFGEAMICALTNWVGPGKAHRETVRAWRLLFSYVSDQLGASLRRGGGADWSACLAGGGGSGHGSASSSCCNIPRIQLLTLVSSGPLTPP